MTGGSTAGQYTGSFKMSSLAFFFAASFSLRLYIFCSALFCTDSFFYSSFLNSLFSYLSAIVMALAVASSSGFFLEMVSRISFCFAFLALFSEKPSDSAGIKISSGLRFCDRKSSSGSWSEDKGGCEES